MPLLVGEDVVGLLGVYMTHEPREFTSEDIAHLQIVANHAAVSLTNERLFNTIQAQKNQLEAAMAEQRRLEEQFPPIPPLCARPVVRRRRPRF